MNQRILLSFTLAMGGALLLAGCTSPDGDDDHAQVVVEMVSGNEFDPETITVEPGTKVTWINRDTLGHTATSDDDGQMFDSGNLNGGQSFSYTFDEPGVYTYHCTPHAFENTEGEYQGMTATVIVLNEDGSTPTPDDGAADDNETADA